MNGAISFQCTFSKKIFSVCSKTPFFVQLGTYCLHFSYFLPAHFNLGDGRERYGRAEKEDRGWGLECRASGLVDGGMSGRRLGSGRAVSPLVANAAPACRCLSIAATEAATAPAPIPLRPGTAPASPSLDVITRPSSLFRRPWHGHARPTATVSPAPAAACPYRAGLAAIV